MAIGELARRYKLSTEFVHGLVEQRLGNFIHGRLHSGLIFTAAYVGRVKCQVLIPSQTSEYTSYQEHCTHNLVFYLFCLMC